jgi:hypothetical protein
MKQELAREQVVVQGTREVDWLGLGLVSGS